MKVLGIITCQILELEFAHLLARDPDLGWISVIEDDFSAGFIKAMEASGCNHFHRIARLGASSPSEFSGPLESVVRVMELGLHNRKRLLQQALVQATLEMSQHVDAIMLGYGLCGNALEKPEEC
jgi:hypothetical protein